MENKNYTEKMNEYDLLIKAIESTRTKPIGIIGDNTNQIFYENFDERTRNPNRGKIWGPSTYKLINDIIPQNTIKVQERTNNGNGLKLTWDSINELRKLSG